jgi:hypothetical protein
MATTSTYAFNPAGSNLVLSAFSRIGIRRTEITAQHMADAENEANLVQVKLANRQPNLWTDELYTETLVESTATYTLNARLIAIQAAYLTTTSGGVSTDRLIFPYSTFEYSAIPDKTQEGPPTAYWYNRQITPQITMWPVPDGNATYTLKLRVCRQIQDVSLTSGTTLDLPYRWLDVFVADLAHRLSRIYAQQLEPARKADALEAWENAAVEDQERVPMYLGMTGIGTYYS